MGGDIYPFPLFMRTKRGVFNDIFESDYPFTVGEITFYFSSIFYRSKFMNEYHDEMKRFNQSANNIYKDKFCLDMTILSLIRLYALIEKRGFYLKVRGEQVSCPDDLKFVLEVEKRGVVL